jgi:hypothetical protein
MVGGEWTYTQKKGPLQKALLRVVGIPILSVIEASQEKT